MSQDSCSYDCAKHSGEVPSYSDISGIGVAIGYIGTAGIVVSIIIFYYFTSYDPEEDPFRNRDGTSNPNSVVKFKENPVDVHILYYTRLVGRVLKSTVRSRDVKSSSGPTGEQKRRNLRLRESCIKCVLAMSDLQILTGISALVSGYTQLQCGISCYHWQLLVYLVWFSSLTHLACLTFLRHYLHTRKAERAWRLAAMGVLVLMLVVAIIPSGNYDWSDLTQIDTQHGPFPTPADYAVCYLSRNHDSDSMTYASMILSVSLISIGFILRVIRLHESLSVRLIGTVRQKASKIAYTFLQIVYTWADVEKSPKGLKRFFVYRPLVALFLTLRVCVDTWSSMFFEIWWLFAAFVWGIIKFASTYVLAPQGNDAWTFGQVLPVVLLAAPLLTVFEFLVSGDAESKGTSGVSAATPSQAPATSSQLISSQQVASDVSSTSSSSNMAPSLDPSLTLKPRVQTLELAVVALTAPPDGVRDDPHAVYQKEYGVYKNLVLLFSFEVVCWTTVVLIFSRSDKLVTILLPEADILKWLPFALVLATFLIALNALLASSLRAVGPSGRILSASHSFLGFMLSIVAPTVWFSEDAFILANVVPISFILFYTAGCLYVICLR